jgi:hypothetical protein
MRKISVSLGLAAIAIALAGCTSGGDEPGTSLSSPEKTMPGPSSPRAPDIQGVDLAKAVKWLQNKGLIADMSSLSPVERGYGRQLIKGYYQSHPQVVVVDYALSGSKRVLIERVECPPEPRAC